MSQTQFAFLKRSMVPSKDAWQKSIDSFSFKVRVQVDPDLVPFEDAGFSPCTWGDTDIDVGFEIYYEPSEDIYDGDEELKSIAGENDYCISMCWGGRMRDCAAVMIASCALAKDFGAIISYQGEEPESLEALISNTHDIIVDAQREA